jgi:KDO2-lipid IV(A) lauroyltransferase
MLDRISVFFLKVFIYPLSLLPFGVLYAIGKLFSFLMQSVFSYRKKVVHDNLKKCFPEKSPKALNDIENQFYDYLGQLFMEGIKSFTMSKSESIKRCFITNPEVLDYYYEQNKDVILLFGHNENWEWTPLASDAQVKHRIGGIYKPVKNKYLNQWIVDNRTRYGSMVLSMKETFPYYESQPKERTAIGFIADQNPGNPKTAVWVDFFGMKTAFVAGPARVAHQFDLPLVFVNIEEQEKGFYEIQFENFIANPHDFSEVEIIQKFAARIEAKIRKRPHVWLWSHKRWKHKLPEN